MVWARFLKVYMVTGTIDRRPGPGRLSSITWKVKELVEAKMNEDDETTATQLHWRRALKSPCVQF